MKKIAMKIANQYLKLGLSRVESCKLAWSKAKKSEFVIEFVKESTGEITTRQAKDAKVNAKGNLLFWSVGDNGFRSTKVANILNIL